MTLLSASPALAQNAAAPTLPPMTIEPQLQLGRSNFALPVVDYRAPDGSWKRSNGIILGHDISPNATVGIGFFKITPKYQESGPLQATKSRKVSLGFSLRF
jgi:hypothetical protein